MTYDSFEEAKIANPYSEIYEFEGYFSSFKGIGSKKCDTSKYCMTVEKFLADGYKFVEGDLIIGFGDELCTVCMVSVTAWNDGGSDDSDSKRYTLSAAALKPRDNDYAMSVMEKKVKTEYVKCEYGDKVSNIIMDFESNAPLYKMVNDEYWTIDELDDLFQLILDDCYIYRRIETEIDERQEFIKAYSILREKFMIQREYEYFDDFMADSGKFKLVDDE
ncbi:hypothetical protein NVP1112O_06 [Vibrio phage 1.112.O._10N.286.46.B11]|nr:hypothetical protein NVP1112O_06 [Vibrio phage 1.112.O._10N.286.46.B11]